MKDDVERLLRAEIARLRTEIKRLLNEYVAEHIRNREST